MKKDNLKEFVAENKNAFDEIEPSADIFGKIQSQLGLEEEKEMPKAKIISFKYWRAAAAVLVLLVGLWAFFQEKRKVENPVVEIKQPLKPEIIPSIDSAIVHRPSENIASRNRHSTTKKANKRTLEPAIVVEDKDDSQVVASIENWRSDLNPSNSASVRLSAVLASGKQSDLSVSDMETLANTMNNDESSNVRLAALDVLSRQTNQAEVKSLILQSVAKQDDPIVQMELLSQLSPEEASTVKKQLVDITQNPLSIDAVRNQAYAALLRSKSNF
ncbi:MAG: hypothetical protein DI598_09785 [Pseudopedobacter saltans]|uniref:HEAT repeat domain-containing protein n=1 Tax=Pseudopedobacter saltans TaxID=151895 RepID=A0A2W5GYY5_9SPHI|nr:MAG: hypothetical protein DI598_09785 [Pseudopedobacter saltans]